MPIPPLEAWTQYHQAEIAKHFPGMSLRRLRTAGALRFDRRGYCLGKHAMEAYYRVLACGTFSPERNASLEGKGQSHELFDNRTNRAVPGSTVSKKPDSVDGEGGRAGHKGAGVHGGSASERSVADRLSELRRKDSSPEKLPGGE